MVEVWGVEPLSVPGTEIPTLFNLFLSVKLPLPSPHFAPPTREGAHFLTNNKNKRFTPSRALVEVCGVEPLSVLRRAIGSCLI